MNWVIMQRTGEKRVKNTQKSVCFLAWPEFSAIEEQFSANEEQFSGIEEQYSGNEEQLTITKP